MTDFTPPSAITCLCMHTNTVLALLRCMGPHTFSYDPIIVSSCAALSGPIGSPSCCGGGALAGRPAPREERRTKRNVRTPVEHSLRPSEEPRQRRLQITRPCQVIDWLRIHRRLGLPAASHDSMPRHGMEASQHGKMSCRW